MKQRFILLVLLGGLALPVSGDSLDTADSLRDVKALPLWDDSSLTLADTSAHAPIGPVKSWVLPAGIILASAAAVWLLFSTRSR